MKVSGKVNKYRRKIMKWLTDHISSTKVPKPLKSHDTLEIHNVLICRPNHRLGNLLLITPLIQEIENHFPTTKIDVLVQGGVAPLLFEKYDSIDRIIQLPKKPFKNLGKYIRTAFSIRKKKYDLVINAVANSSSGRIYTLLSSSKYKLFDALHLYEDNMTDNNNEVHIAKYQIISLRGYFKKLEYKFLEKKIPLLNIKLNNDELSGGKELLKTLVPPIKKTLSIYTFATGAKCYSKEWWLPFYERLVDEFGDTYNILEVLPMENVSQINFKAPAYYSKNIREMASVMANTEIYIGADCGIMHLASAAQIPVLGLFSKSNILTYEPYGNGSIGMNTNKKGIDAYIMEIKKILS